MNFVATAFRVMTNQGPSAFPDSEQTRVILLGLINIFQFKNQTDELPIADYLYDTYKTWESACVAKAQGTTNDEIENIISLMQKATIS